MASDDKSAKEYGTVIIVKHRALTGRYRTRRRVKSYLGASVLDLYTRTRGSGGIAHLGKCLDLALKGRAKLKIEMCHRCALGKLSSGIG